MFSEPLSEAGDTLTLDELTERVGMSVRNIRFYTSKGLVPPPIRQGRSGYYTVDHVVRLELMAELQAHGFTLAAIEKYLSRIPADASPETIALHRTLLAPWSSDSSELMSREEVDRRAGRSLGEEDLRALEEMAVLAPGPEGCFHVNSTYLSIGVGLLDLGFPIEAAKATREIYLAHGREIAEELTEVFRTKVKPVLEETGTSPEQMREILEKIKPLSIASLVAAYEGAVDEMRREAISRRIS